MKFTITLIGLIATQAIGTLSMPTLGSDEPEDCGSLGLAEWDLDNLPEGVDATKLRTCKEHPRALMSPRKDDANLNVLQERACYIGNLNYGCSGGYCWKKCSPPGIHGPPVGEWCWMAWNQGYGYWQKCTDERECYNAIVLNAADCGAGSCSDCGCGC